jgi:hypothetical protein
MSLFSKGATIKPIAIAVFILALSCNGGGLELKHWILELRSVSSKPVIIEIPVQVGETITLHFIHSWEKMPVDEVLMISGDGDFILKEAQFPRLGAGYDAPPVSGNYTLKDGNILITDMNVRLKKIPLRIGTVAKHQLIIKGAIIDLAGLFGKGSRIDIQLRSKPLVEN